ncbi:MAG: hypothetical protein GF329_19070 [Candidatus Lokiarchaeota archaeon]|nr:hypothetical protein [Candidatus Lokiarchaeota archaeon]
MKISKQKVWILASLMIIDGLIGLILSVFYNWDIFALVLSVILLLAGFLIPMINMSREIKFPFIPFFVLILLIALGIVYLFILLIYPTLWASQLVYFIFFLSIILFFVFIYIVQKEKSSY